MASEGYTLDLQNPKEISKFPNKMGAQRKGNCEPKKKKQPNQKQIPQQNGSPKLRTSNINATKSLGLKGKV